MKSRVLIAVEERLNCGGPSVKDFVKVERGLVEIIDLKLKESTYDTQSTIYQDTLFYIKRLGEKRFLRKDGSVKEAAFYQYAYIDKSTWSDMKHGLLTPSKKTLFKLALALRLSEDETRALLGKAHQDFELKNFQERLILALIELRNERYHLDVDDFVEVLEYYQRNGPEPFDSIYDTPRMIAERKNGSEA